MCWWVSRPVMLPSSLPLPIGTRLGTATAGMWDRHEFWGGVQVLDQRFFV